MIVVWFVLVFDLGMLTGALLYRRKYRRDEFPRFHYRCDEHALDTFNSDIADAHELTEHA